MSQQADSRRAVSMPQLTVLKPKENIDGWQVDEVLGSGTFGAVYKVHNAKSLEIAAMKVESRSQSQGNRTLSFEASVIIHLNKRGARNTCTLLGYGKKDTFDYMIMTLVGPSFEKVIEMNAKKGETKASKMSYYTAMYCCLHGLLALEDVHRAGFVHRDVKPLNFTIGPSTNPSLIYLIDFGTARKYLKPNGLQHRPRARCAFRGTVHYASPFALRGEEQARRDDLWSWLYVLIRLTSGTLPWLNLKPLNDYYADLEQYAVCKETAAKNPKHFLEGCPPIFNEIVKSLFPLKFYDSPDYMVIESILRSTMQACHVDGSPPPFDWESRICMTTVAVSKSSSKK